MLIHIRTYTHIRAGPVACCLCIYVHIFTYVQGLMRAAGVPEEEIDSISAAVSVSYAHAHMMDDALMAGGFCVCVCVSMYVCVCACACVCVLSF
jgi:hypothetical protein